MLMEWYGMYVCVRLCFIFGDKGRDRKRERESEGPQQSSLILVKLRPWLLIPPQGKKKKKASKAQNEEPAQSEESDNAEDEVEAEKPKEKP